MADSQYLSNNNFYRAQRENFILRGYRLSFGILAAVLAVQFCGAIRSFLIRKMLLCELFFTK